MKIENLDRARALALLIKGIEGEIKSIQEIIENPDRNNSGALHEIADILSPFPNMLTSEVIEDLAITLLKAMKEELRKAHQEVSEL